MLFMMSIIICYDFTHVSRTPLLLLSLYKCIPHVYQDLDNAFSCISVLHGLDICIL